MFHPYATVTGVFGELLGGHAGPVGCSLVSQEFYETDKTRGFLRGYILQVGRSGVPLHTALGGAGDHLVPWGERHHAVFAARHLRTATIAVIGEDLPDPTQPRRHRPGTHRRQRHPGAKGPLQPQREQSKTHEARGRKCSRGTAGGGRTRDDRHQSIPIFGLASHGDGSHGDRSGQFGGRPLGPRSRGR